MIISLGFFHVLARARTYHEFCFMEIIDLKEALSIISSGKPFSIKWVQFDKKRKTGGKIKYMPSMVGSTEETRNKVLEKNTDPLASKSRNHFDNMTRTLLIVIDGLVTNSFRTVHVFLILEINGKKLML